MKMTTYKQNNLQQPSVYYYCCRSGARLPQAKKRDKRQFTLNKIFEYTRISNDGIKVHVNQKLIKGNEISARHFGGGRKRNLTATVSIRPQLG